MTPIRKTLSIFDSVKNKPKLMQKVIYTGKTIDGQTGELLEFKTITRKTEKQEQFIKMYVEDLGSLIGCSNSEKNFILAALSLGYVEYETNELLLTKARKQRIAEMAEVDYRSMQNSFYRLIKKNVIVKEGGTYILNPLLFFSGTETERSKLFELRIQYKLK